MKSKFLFLILIVALSVLAWFTYPVIGDRYFVNQKTESIPLSPEESVVPMPDAGTAETDIEEIDKTVEEQKVLKSEGKVLQEITRDNCDSECEDFSGADLEYCQQVCGLKPLQENPTGCENKSGIQKDYCLKDLAVSKKDFKVCDEIADANVKKTCQNRVTEDILDEQLFESE